MDITRKRFIDGQADLPTKDFREAQPLGKVADHRPRSREKPRLTQHFQLHVWMT